MTRERYTIKTKSGRYVKVKKGELYGIDGPYGFYINFQEQPPGGEGRVHTHIWIGNDTFPGLIPELYSFVTWDYEWYPKNVSMFAMIYAWELNEDETEFEGPNPIYELVVYRKLSKKHMDHICDWVDDVLSEFIPRMGMDGLFGGLDSE